MSPREKRALRIDMWSRALAAENEEVRACAAAELQKMGVKPQAPETRSPTVEQCMDLILEYLANGDDSKEMLELCKMHGSDDTTIRKARKKLGVKSRPPDCIGGKWKVYIP